MKLCPTCNRTYADDGFTFCLDDGARLSAPYDPQATLQLPAARDTGQPKTETLKTLPVPDQHPHAQQVAPRADSPFNYRPADVAGAFPQKRGSRTSMVLGGVIVILSLGVILLGYLVWRGNQNPPSEASKSDANIQGDHAVTPTPTATPAGNVNVNAGGDRPRKPSGNTDSQWLEGVWEGTAHQSTPKMTYSVRLTAANNAYSIEYPSLRCSGKWNLVETGEGSAKFKEVITRGLDRCSTDGDISVEKISDHELSYKYSLPFVGEIVAGTLSKK